MEEDPFSGMEIQSHEFLDELDGRSVCPQCQKSRKYYCYTCYVPVSGIEDKVPKVKLPFKIDIIKHPSECDGKSTSTHAGVISPDDVKIYTYPCIPDYPDTERVVLVFPGEKSLSLEELVTRERPRTQTKENCETKVISNMEAHKCQSQGSAEMSTESMEVRGSNGTDSDQQTNQTDKAELTPVTELEGDTKIKESCPVKRKHAVTCTDQLSECKRQRFSAPFDRAVFIDSTWNQTKRISSDERLKDLPCVELKTRKTQFWRHQKNNPATYLSTIEAVYYFVRDFHDLVMTSDYKGQYDNLLFFFSFMYQKIRRMYKGGGELKAYKQRADKQ